jgi:hypothetical protein
MHEKGRIVVCVCIYAGSSCTNECSMHKVPDISYMFMHFSSFLPLMGFFFGYPCYPEMVDKMGLLIYWELEYLERTHNNCGSSHMNACGLHLCYVVAAEK